MVDERTLAAVGALAVAGAALSFMEPLSLIFYEEPKRPRDWFFGLAGTWKVIAWWPLMAYWLGYSGAISMWIFVAGVALAGAWWFAVRRWLATPVEQWLNRGRARGSLLRLRLLLTLLMVMSGAGVAVAAVAEPLAFPRDY